MYSLIVSKLGIEPPTSTVTFQLNVFTVADGSQGKRSLELWSQVASGSSHTVAARRFSEQRHCFRLLMKAAHFARPGFFLLPQLASRY